MEFEEGENVFHERQKDVDKEVLAHISSCSICRRNLFRLSKDIVTQDMLTCDECSSRLPAYDETLHAISPQLNGYSASLSLFDMLIVTLHLSSCISCRTSYRVLKQLWDEDENSWSE